MANPEPLNVLFLCTGNSARSIIAVAILNRESAGRFGAFSAGSHPKGQVHPAALRLLEQLRYDTAGARSKSRDEFNRPGGPRLDFVFTLCDDAAETCPLWPGQPIIAHWGLPDPAAATGSPAQIALAFADTHRMLGNRIGLLLSLPLAALDRISLQRRLEEIGRPAEAPSRT